jgi:hypothetical protein
MEQVDFLANVYSKTAGRMASKELALTNLAEEPELFRPHNYIFVHDNMVPGEEDGWIALAKKPRKLPKRRQPTASLANRALSKLPQPKQWLIVSLMKDALSAAVPLTLCFVAGLVLLRMEKWISQQARQHSSTGKVGVMLAMLWRAWACRSPIDPLDIKIAV